MRRYMGRLSASANTGITISDVPNETFKVIDGLAYQYDVPRSLIAICALDTLARKPEAIESELRFRLPRVDKRAPRFKNGKPSKKIKGFARKQDEVCKEIHGALPVTGCRYPNCGCKL